MTYADMFQFIAYANHWLNSNKNNTKIHYALRKVIKAANKLVADYQEKLEEININHCSVDDKGIILKDDKNEYRFTKDCLLKRNKERRFLFDSTVTVTPFYVADKSLLSDDDIENFRGFIVEADYASE
jgi:hypothetical protein